MLKQAYEIHPAAKLFPMMSGAEFKALKKSIKENGQREDITIWCNQLLDGRNRWQACDELGIEPECCELDESVDPLQYVLDHNLHRRHLSTTQRATVAAEVANMKRGQPKKSNGSIDPLNETSNEQAAKMLNVSPASVKRAKALNQNAAPEVVEAMRDNKLSLNAAEQLVKAVPDKKEQAKIVSEGKAAVRERVKKSKPKPKANPKPKVTTTTEVEWKDVEFDEPEVCKLDEFKKFWSDCDDVAKAAIRIWIEEQMQAGA